MKVVFVLFFLLCSEFAFARHFAFGDKEKIHFLDTVPITDNNGDKLFLGYKTTQVNFFMPLYTKDNGYILGKMSDYGHTYYPLDKYKNKISSWQSNELLPSVLPKYSVDSLSFLYILLGSIVLLFGYSYLLHKNKKIANVSIVILLSGVIGYLVYTTVLDGRAKHNLIADFERYTDCQKNHNTQCVVSYVPFASRYYVKQQLNISYEDLFKLAISEFQKQHLVIKNKKLKTVQIDRCNYFSNVYVATVTSNQEVETTTGTRKVIDKVFAISVDRGVTWKFVAPIEGLTAQAYPFVKEFQ